MRLLPILIILLACDPSGPPNPGRDGGIVDGGVDGTADADGDGISDEREGRASGLDTDGDGTPDFRDTDSDDDGIDDAREAGDADITTPPRDSDFDGTPDFQDTDSDNNTILDSDEADIDSDGDGLLDFQDPDDDNDQVSDAEELRDHGADIDSDGDGLVDFKDPDRDDDTINDGHERDADTDGDDLLDWVDLDSDSDGIPDSVEAGDDDLNTVPVDTDMDSIPDFRDPDSDDDGLSDLDETLLGTNPLLGDSDGDGVSDLIESAAGTDPLDGAVNPRTEGNFVFVVPWMDDPSPLEDTLEFSTSIQFADVYFVFDRSGSMSGEINAMRTAVNTVLSDLTCTDFGVACADDDICGADQICSLEGSCIQDPAMSTCVPSIWSGAGRYTGSYTNSLSLQANPAATGTAIGSDTGGSDEDFFEMATCVATGTCGRGCTTASSMLGCPEFRPEAVRLLVAFSDENSDGGSLGAASAAMNTAGIKFIGVWSGSPGSSARNDMLNLARETGSLSGAGTPLVFEGMDAAVSGVVTSAITEVVRGVPLRATIEATEVADDDGDALRFIDRLVVNVGGVGACTPVVDTEDTNMDGLDDAFSAILPGTSVCWDVVPFRNDDIQEPSTSPLVYKALLTVFGDGSPLDERTVFFLVPPRVEVPQGPE
ncbi:MAG: hypothetical protein ACI9KE_000479 [Polyangiales bacterium]|jgi:hypothetical protein